MGAPGPAIWAAAAVGHGLLLLAAVLAFRPSPPLPEPDRQALIVTLVTPEPEPQSAPEPPPQEAPAETPPQPSTPPPTLYDVRPSLTPPPDAFEVLTAPGADGPALALSASVQQVLARASGCATRLERGAPRPDCPPLPERLALAGPGTGAFLDDTVLDRHGVEALWSTVTSYVSTHVVDATMFDGRAGDPQAPETEWSFYGKANPLLVDPRIFNAQTGEVTILRQTGER